MPGSLKFIELIKSDLTKNHKITHIIIRLFQYHIFLQWAHSQFQARDHFKCKNVCMHEFPCSPSKMKISCFGKVASSSDSMKISISLFLSTQFSFSISLSLLPSLSLLNHWVRIDACCSYGYFIPAFTISYPRFLAFASFTIGKVVFAMHNSESQREHI